MISIFIAGNVPSSKNSKLWTGRKLVWSKTARDYVKNTEDYWKNNREIFVKTVENKNLPLEVTFKFIRGSRHKFDYVNPLQTVLDLMVMYEWIEDDNADIIIPIFVPYKYSKENPGVIISVV